MGPFFALLNRSAGASRLRATEQMSVNVRDKAMRATLNNGLRAPAIRLQKDLLMLMDCE
jgi:hypothetical protein